MKALLVALVVLSFATTARAEVPKTIAFAARLADDASGAPLEGTQHVEFALFDAAIAGTSVWTEARDLEVEDGVVFVELGAVTPFAPAVFTGKPLFLAVKLGEVAMEPRVPLASVPYAMHAGETDTIAGLTVEDLQQRVTGTCGAQSFVTGVNADGTVVCAPDLSGTGDITDVLAAGGGIVGGGTAGSVTLALATCDPGMVLKSNGGGWACGPDQNAGGDITGVTTAGTSGLQGGTANGEATLSLLTTCSAGQMLKWNGGAWTCANDVDTSSTGDITSVVTATGSGLVGGVGAGDAFLSLITGCSGGQLLKWNGSVWGCANDTGIASVTTPATGGLIGGGTTGDLTISLLTTCGVGQLLEWNGTAWACANDDNSVSSVVAGNGLTGGGTGAATLAVGAGTGITVAADTVALDTVFTDARYVRKTGPAGRTCPTGYLAAGTGLCVQNVEGSGLTFTGAISRCRNEGTHLCTAAEMRAVMASGVAVQGGVSQDWMADQVADDTALYVNAVGSSENPDGERDTATASFGRCCTVIE